MRKLSIFLTLTVILIAYGQTLQMNFWQDDLALMFKLQNPEGRAGSFGEGLWQRGSYQYLVVPFVPFFTLFGLHPFGYFLVGLLTYILAAGAFYLFTKELFLNKKPAFFSTIIFAAGYIGSNTMFRIINSWQTNIGLILVMLTFWMFTKYLRKKEFVTYILSIILFLATIELVFIRSHSLILPILALDILLGVNALNIKQLFFLIFRQLPFWFLWYQWYLKDSEHGGTGLISILQDILVRKEVEKLSAFFANVGNILISDTLQVKILSAFTKPQILWASILITVISLILVFFISKIFSASNKIRILTFIGLLSTMLLNLFFVSKDPFWYRDLQSQISGLIGIQGIILITYLVIVLWQSKKNLSIALFFGLIFLLSQVFGYYSKYPTAILSTTHRYFSHAFLGFCIIFGSITYFLTERFQRKGLWLLTVIVGANLLLGFSYQQRFVAENSLPAKKFYSELRSFLPKIQKGDYFYFDVENNDFYQRQFNEFFGVGSMPESTALAVYYGIDRYELSRFIDFNEMIFNMDKNNISPDNVHSFYYGAKGLIDTTSNLQSALEGGSREKMLEIKDNLSSLVLLQNGNTTPTSYLILSFKAKILPKIKDVDINPSKEKLDVQHIINYLLVRQNYYKQVKAKSLSEWKSQEVQYVTDNDPQTSFRGHRIYWHDKSLESIILDMGIVKTAGAVVWRNWSNALTPTSYTIGLSLDGQNWTEVKKVMNGEEKEAGEMVVDTFDPRETKFVRFTITETLSDDSPAFSEIEVVDSTYTDLDPKLGNDFLSNPLSFLNKPQDLSAVLPRLGSLLDIQIEWETDKRKNVKRIPIGGFEEIRDYQVILDPGGTILKNISLTVPSIPANIDVSTATLRNISLKEIKDRGLIKRFVEN